MCDCLKNNFIIKLNSNNIQIFKGIFEMLFNFKQNYLKKLGFKSNCKKMNKY